MIKEIKDLLEQMGVGAEVVVESDEHTAHLQLPLGVIDGGIYENSSWGDAVIEDTDAVLDFEVGYIYDDEFEIGEGFVNLNYLPESGLAYGGDLEDVIVNRIHDLYPGISACGSEQGMQGERYLSLDVEVA